MGGAGSGIFGETGDVAVDPQQGGAEQGLVEEDPNGMYALLGVPRYDTPGSSAYLRLGAAMPGAGDPTRWTSPTPTGEDLAALVQGFADDARDRKGPATDPANQPPQETLVTGLSGGLHEGDPIDAAARGGESMILHTKGGWRDHSDGNRISTTRGDKVEVIRGNYKLLVLGRQDTRQVGDATARRTLISDSAGADLSGGLVDTDPRDLNFPGVGLEVVYNWQKDSDGSWAWTQTTTVGSESPPHIDSNYRMESKSFFDQQISTLGSANKRVSHVGQETYATVLWNYTDVGGTNSTTTKGDELLTMTYAASVNDITNALFTLEARLMIVLGLEIDLSEIIALVQLVAAMVNVWAGIVFDDHVGLHSDVHVGLHQEVHVGLHAEHHDVLHAETHTGDHTDLHNGSHVDLHNIHFTTETVHVTLADNTVELGDDHVLARQVATHLLQSNRLSTAAQQALQTAVAHMDS